MTQAGGNIVLVGPMGAGKSAEGRLLARKRQLDFVDSDEELEARTGVDIPFIFEKEGEAGFRDRESRVLADLAGRSGVVLATGGGAVMRDDNRKVLGGCGLVIYLQTSVEQQLSRTSHGRHRPLLDTDDPRAVLEALMEKRHPLYQQLADLVIDTNGRKVPSVVYEICERLDDAL
ncbi:MAG: shikimate kinase AroK [Pseudomonadota bacterium]